MAELSDDTSPVHAGRALGHSPARRAGALVSSVALGATLAVLAPAASAQAAKPTCHGRKATIVVTVATHQPVHGTAGNDVIVGSPGNDVIRAGGGNDLVCGGDGADQLYGGPGNDHLYGQRDRLHLADEDGLEREGDTLRGGPGNDHLDGGVDNRAADIIVFDEYSWDQSAHGIHLDLRRGTAHGEGTDTIVTTGRYTITTSPHADVVDGTNHRDIIASGSGPDLVRGHDGNDYITVDSPINGPGKDNDTVAGGPGRDWILSNHGKDHLSGNGGDDRIEASGISNDVLEGGPGDDFFVSDITDTTGPQDIDGGPGRDGMQLNSGVINPRHAASSGTFDMTSGVMTFTLHHKVSLQVHVESAILATWNTHWDVTGTKGDDGIYADMEVAGADFTGRAGDDTFRGSDHDDVFNGGPGTDTGDMWDGDDTCISVEVITDDGCEHVS